MKKSKYKIKLKIPKQIHQQMLNDLRRSHDFAYERVGFLFTKSKKLNKNEILVTASEYIPVEDENYIKDRSVGAKINSFAIEKAMQEILDRNSGCFHVHLHNHSGTPSPSFTDMKSLPGLIKSFSNYSTEQVNGMLILSYDSFYAYVNSDDEKKYTTPELISVVGYPLNLFYPNLTKSIKSKIYDRQTFLGQSSEFLLENVKVGIIGYGGGGSHIGQQLAHLGVKNIMIFDDDIVEDTNLNRLIGAWFSDVKKALLKTSVAKRVIKKLLPEANVTAVNSRWQQNSELLQTCDIVFGCVDSYSERQQLEAECRRYLIPYIDIGMDVHKLENQSSLITGQVILSMPGQPCMFCFDFLDDNKLAKEAAKYGNVGGKPQVVWPNGVLASTAVGIFVDLVTGWTKQENKQIYLSYNGNSGYIKDHMILEYTNEDCIHYKLIETGKPQFIVL